MTIHYTVHKETEFDYSIIHLRSILGNLCQKPNESKIFDYSAKPFIGEVEESSFWMEKNSSLMPGSFGVFKYAFTQIMGSFDYEEETLKLHLYCRVKPWITYALLIGLSLNIFLIFRISETSGFFAYFWLLPFVLIIALIYFNVKKDLYSFIQILKTD